MPAVKTAMDNWNVAAAESGANVHFSFKGLTNGEQIRQGDLILIRQRVYGKRNRHLARLEAHSLRSDQLIDWGLILVDPRVKDGTVLTNIVAHEIGHSMGLLDCYHCQSGTTAMGLLKSAEESNGIEGPTICDRSSVLAAYQQMKHHFTRRNYYKPRSLRTKRKVANTVRAGRQKAARQQGSKQKAEDLASSVRPAVHYSRLSTKPSSQRRPKIGQGVLPQPSRWTTI
jgi:hypothetical protein